MTAWHALGRPLVLGHRGVRRPDGPPENTLAAIAEAERQGADGVEVDARPCADGELVVAHDPGLERVTSGRDGRAVAALSRRELGAVDLGGGEHVPTLLAVLDHCRARGLALNVELKHDVPDRRALVVAAARALGGHDPAHPLLVSSFDPVMLLGLRLLLPRQPVALLMHRDWPAGEPAQHARPSLAARLPPSARRLVSRAALAAVAAAAVHPERTLVTAASVRAWQARGLRVHVWTVDAAAEVRDLHHLGVDGFICDAPEQVRATLDALGSTAHERRATP
ncbi:MAG: glycerophosphodiester phosphodiesterase [Polyangiaceae bacterium]|nr:glycerophosphodiester phosphodiesterase [Polyangiaceae bacterium]